MNRIIKVDRVNTLEEAVMLQDLGVNIIGIYFGKDIRFNDDREMTKNLLIDIKNKLKPATEICCQITSDYKGNIFEIADLCSYLQILDFDFDYLSENIFQNKLKDKIIYSITSISYDDEISYVLSSIQDKSQLSPSFIHADLLASMDKSWNFLKEECPKYPDLLQIEDVNNFSNQYPLIIGIDSNLDNICECIAMMPNIRGFNFALANVEPNNNDVHHVEYKKLCELLRLIKK